MELDTCINEASDLYHNGESLTFIALRYGCSAQTVANHFRAAGIQLRPGLGRRITRHMNGDVYGVLKVISTNFKNQQTVCTCLCECGITKDIKACLLRSGATTSCGCKGNANKKLWKGYEGISGNVWNRIRDGARSRKSKIKSEFNITIEEAWEIFQKQNSKCALSGVPIYLPKTGKEYHEDLKTASLDRIDSSKGYIKGNVQWLHKDINRLKSDFPEYEFLRLCKLIVEYQKSSGTM